MIEYGGRNSIIRALSFLTLYRSPATCQVIEGCTIPVDIILKSSDGGLFGAHSRNLELFADGFPLSGSTIKSDFPEIVPLTDKGDTLLLFLKFTHNHPAPDLTGLNIDSLVDLAKISDKYCNYIALAACRQPMRVLSENSREDALKALHFKAIHHDLEGIDAIARRTLDFPAVHMLKEVFGGHHLREFAVWVQYQASYEVFKKKYQDTLNQPIDPFYARGYDHRSICTATNFIATVRPMAQQAFCSLEDFNKVIDMTVKYQRKQPCTGSSSCAGYNLWCSNVRNVLKSPPSWTDFTAELTSQLDT
ncbi:hypothetical protein L218DRAFT_1082472 [Marasmius fiardii PR-910]|nr:hypothetical protein L218DRAFT_1082472 [Marasmius fiardii PR-910]